ncbi:MAG: hypothetical protein M3Y71_00325 [Actinomycetota bacterium]|nr:hypothetical protein [Actinomycetota bacterium]
MAARPSMMTRVNALLAPVLRTRLVAGLARSEPCELRYRGRRSGREVTLDAWCRPTEDGLVIGVVMPDRKAWWRNFRDTPHPIEVRHHGVWRAGTGLVAEPAPGKVEVGITYDPRGDGTTPRSAD